MQGNSCRLWIGSQQNVEAIQSALVGAFDGQFEGLGVSCSLDRNDGFDAGRQDPKDFIATSPWTAWLEAMQSDERAIETFQASICHLISFLRKQGFSIIAACDFEDRVVAETGWNWTADQPLPPD